jgi:crossover junction endodeoxyribonuclease RusA
MQYELTIPIRAVTKGRPRLGRRRRAYTPARTIEFESAIGEAWRQAYPELSPLTGPLGMQVVVMSNHIQVAVWELEESHRPKYIQGDADNYFKSLADGLNGVAYVDDKQLHHIEIMLSKDIPQEVPGE